jgi:hypothetical protein
MKRPKNGGKLGQKEYFLPHALMTKPLREMQLASKSTIFSVTEPLRFCSNFQ